MTYAEITIRDRNPIKRWLQQRRYADALKCLSKIESNNRLQVLDFGAGNGELIRTLALSRSIEASVFEPTPALMSEARVNLADLDAVAFFESLDSVESGIFDYVFCLEVFEHLPAVETANAMDQIHRLLKPNGLAVIGVPHELFLPALIKGLFRMARRYGDFDALPGNILAAFRGHPPIDRPTAEIAPGVRYHFYHLGFDYRAVERRLKVKFQLVEKWFSPFPILGAVFNSEVYFLFRKIEP